jgi:hypothetical protein
VPPVGSHHEEDIEMDVARGILYLSKCFLFCFFFVLLFFAGSLVFLAFVSAGDLTKAM